MNPLTQELLNRSKIRKSSELDFIEYGDSPDIDQVAGAVEWRKGQVAKSRKHTADLLRALRKPPFVPQSSGMRSRVALAYHLSTQL